MAIHTSPTGLGKRLKNIFILLTVGLILQNVDGADASGLSFDGLKQRLIQEGFDAIRINSIYDSPGVHFEIEGISLFFMHSESRINYDQFLSRRSIRKAKQYMKAHDRDLDHSEKAFGVDKEIITAILLVETRLGAYMGNKSILNTLSTMAALSDPHLREVFWLKIPSEKRFEKKIYNEKASEKSAWAYNELKAYLSYVEQEGFDPTEIKGSYAGAIGLAQFMPSNILKLARDGNNDGSIDLFSHPDAIASIANYLSHHQWQLGMGKDQAYRVLLSYNYSKPYADTLLKIAEKLRK